MSSPPLPEPVFVDVAVDPHAALPDGLMLRFKAAPDATVVPISRVEYTPEDADEAGPFRVEGRDGADRPCSARAVTVEDSAAGVSVLVFGGDHGLRLFDERDPGAEPRAEPYLLLPPFIIERTPALRPAMTVRAEAALPTRFGEFRVVAFDGPEGDDKEHVAVVRGDVAGRSGVLTRLHSECLTGDALGSLRCDCRDQLEAALQAIGQADAGVLLYLRQEGRGIGLVNKIRAYALQDGGLDTVDANLALGFRDDERDYAVAAHMLAALGVRAVRLMTNNPKKIEQLAQYGVVVEGRVPHVLPPNGHNRFYLETKANRSGHFIDLAGKPHLEEQREPVVVRGMGSVDDADE
ncbi:GTP cyclohydrolase II [Myxococcota bacterium]|nr:GTP cyclohydrolase II [Myxococcota bacterium]